MDLKKYKDISTLHKRICRSCGMCCHLRIFLETEGIHFVPTAQKIKDLDETDRRFFSLTVCEFYNVETSKCDNYENRPAQCKKYFCRGNPKEQTVVVNGKPDAEKIKQIIGSEDN